MHEIGVQQVIWKSKILNQEPEKEIQNKVRIQNRYELNSKQNPIKCNWTMAWQQRQMKFEFFSAKFSGSSSFKL